MYIPLNVHNVTGAIDLQLQSLNKPSIAVVPLSGKYSREDIVCEW